MARRTNKIWRPRALWYRRPVTQVIPDRREATRHEVKRRAVQQIETECNESGRCVHCESTDEDDVRKPRLTP